MDTSSHIKLSLKKQKLSLVIFAGVLLRLIALHKGIWFDEALSIYLAQQPLHELMVLHLKAIDLTFPFFNFLLHFWLTLSDSLLWARLFSLMSGIVTIYTAYKLAFYLFDEYTALLSASLVSFSEMFILCSVEVRQYSLFTLFALLAIYHFFSLIESPSIRSIFLYIFFTALAIYTHFFGFFLLLINISILSLYRNRLAYVMKKWMSAIAWLTLIVLPLMLYYIHAYFLLNKLGTYIYPPSVRNMVSMFIEYSDNLYFCIFYSFLLIILAVSKYNNVSKTGSFYQKIKMFVLGVYSNFKLTSAILVLSLPLVMASVLSMGRVSIFGTKYFLPYFLFFYLLISSVVARYAKSSFRSTVILLIVGATFLNALRYSIIIGYLKPQLHPEKVVRFLNQELKNGDLITVTNIYYSLSILVYLHKPIKIIADQQSVNAAKEYKAAFLTNNIFPIKDFVITENSSLKNYSRLWIIALDSDNLSLLPWIAKDKALNLIKKTYIGNYVIWLYRLA